MPSGPVDGESDGDAHILYPPAAGPGGGSSSRGRALSHGGSHASEPEMERSSVPDRSPPSPTLPTSAAAPADTRGPSFTSQHSPEYVHASSREIAGVMDAICSLAAT